MKVKIHKYINEDNQEITIHGLIGFKVTSLYLNHIRLFISWNKNNPENMVHNVKDITIVSPLPPPLASKEPRQRPLSSAKPGRSKSSSTTSYDAAQ